MWERPLTSRHSETDSDTGVGVAAADVTATAAVMSTFVCASIA
jgi:hypothetical protein